MSYFLVLGIEYKKYSKPADITLHVGDTFIDTFSLDRDFHHANDIIAQIETNWYKKNNKEHWLTHIALKDSVEKDIPAFFRVYEIDDHAVKDKLKIKVKNSNSDFSNGFIKNSSLIRFPMAALIPKKLTKNRAEMLMKVLIKLNNDLSTKNKAKNPALRTQRWPCAEYFYVARDNDVYEKSGIMTKHWWIGGSFTAEFKIVNIGGIKHLAPTEEDKWLQDPQDHTVNDLFLASCKQLLNIYDENS